MNRENAIDYLQRKGKIRNDTTIVEEKVVKVPKVTKNERKERPVFNKEEEAEIDTVMKEGKIYGDPIAEVRW